MGKLPGAVEVSAQAPSATAAAHAPPQPSDTTTFPSGVPTVDVTL